MPSFVDGLFEESEQSKTAVPTNSDKDAGSSLSKLKSRLVKAFSTKMLAEDDFEKNSFDEDYDKIEAEMAAEQDRIAEEKKRSSISSKRSKVFSIDFIRSRLSSTFQKYSSRSCVVKIITLIIFWIIVIFLIVMLVGLHGRSDFRTEKNHKSSKQPSNNNVKEEITTSKPSSSPSTLQPSSSPSTLQPSSSPSTMQPSSYPPNTIAPSASSSISTTSKLTDSNISAQPEEVTATYNTETEAANNAETEAANNTNTEASNNTKTEAANNKNTEAVNKTKTEAIVDAAEVEDEEEIKPPTTISLNDLQTMLIPISGRAALFRESSHQNKAVTWLFDHYESFSSSFKSINEAYVISLLYFSTGGEEWTNPTIFKIKDSSSLIPSFFSSSSSICDWNDDDKGIHCDDSKTNITQIKLGNCNLNGTIPSELSHLSSLEILYLQTNNLIGSIPSEFGTLDFIKHLDFHNNGLTGTIPSEIGNLGNESPHDDSTHLSLSLQNNRLTGAIPSEMGMMPARAIDLSTNFLYGKIPTELGKLSLLRNLNLGKNILTGGIPTEFGDLSRLQTLILEENKLSLIIPPELGKLSPEDFRSLRVDGNEIEGTLPTTLGNLHGLTAINIHNNRITGNLNPIFCDLSSSVNINKIFANLTILRADTNCAITSPNEEAIFDSTQVTCDCCCCRCIDTEKSELQD